MRTTSDVTTLVTDHVSSSHDAVQSEPPSSTCTSVGTLDDMLMIPPPRTRVPIVAARNPRLRSRAGSSIGSALRHSTTANRTSITSAAANTRDHAAGEADRAWVSPLTSNVIAAPSVTTPGRSSRRGCSAADSGSRRLGTSRASASTPTTT